MAATDQLLHQSREQAEINMLQAKMGGSEGEKKRINLLVSITMNRSRWKSIRTQPVFQ